MTERRLRQDAQGGILPAGLYERLLDGSLARVLSGVSNYIVDETVDPEERHLLLVDHLQSILAAALEGDRPAEEVALVNDLLSLVRRRAAEDADTMDTEISGPARVLRRVGDGERRGPRTGLRQPWLFTAGHGEPALLTELRAELADADRVDLLMSFITWNGVRKIADLLEAATAVGADGRPRLSLRVVTTTYTGATEARAVDWLARLPGVAVKISLDGRRTRLHAKTWMFRRLSGFGTAYVGSANLSGAALAGGLEWTVKFTQAGNRALFERATAQFESVWADAEFQTYQPDEPGQRQALERALAEQRGRDGDAALPALSTWFGIEPQPFQAAILDRLEAERRHGRTRNLLVAATGTGKTVIAALDYRRSCERDGGRPRLLFVAHREEILKQARATYAQVLRDAGFGSLLVGGHDSGDYDHCFASIQSLNSKNLIKRLGADYWHTVVVDECHHAAAASYDGLLAEIRPRVLLGLTATPERADGRNIAALFDRRPDGSPAAELRLWEALDQQLLCPFEYYGCADETDLQDVPWDRAGETKRLDELLTGNDARAATVINAFHDKVAEPHRARALAFCVSVAHAEFMARAFAKAGIPAEAVTGNTAATDRRSAPARLQRRELNVICTCDLYNEGIDLPAVDTLLFLRPTQSPVLFQQQLGRGLRLADGKDSCVVIDLVGRHRVDFRFDRFLSILTGLPRARLVEQVEHGFAHLPPGCHVHLDPISRERVLASLRAVTQQSWRRLTAELAHYATLPGKSDPTLRAFLQDQNLDLEELYSGGGAAPRGWNVLKRRAGLLRTTHGPWEEAFGWSLVNMLHEDDPVLLALGQKVAAGEVNHDTASPADRRRFDLLASELFPGRDDPCTGRQLISRLAEDHVAADELAQLTAILNESADLPPRSLPGCPADWPFILHAAYSLREICLGCGWLAPDKRYLPQAGLLRLPDFRIELMMVTLDKTSGFSASTAYHDYAVTRSRFHWQTQNSCSPDLEAGHRYIDQADNGWTFLLFVRERKGQAYRALGPVDFVSAEGARPMSIVWDLREVMPYELFQRYSVLRSA